MPILKTLECWPPFPLGVNYGGSPVLRPPAPAGEDEEGLVRGVFDSVASSYDLTDDAMSLGVHLLLKDSFVCLLHPGSRGPVRCIDAAGGTGDIALRVLDHARETYGDRETAWMWSTSTERCSRTVKNASKRRCTTTVRALSSVFLILEDS